MSSWFSDLGNQALAFVDSVADSAIASVENANAELEEERNKLREEEAQKGNQPRLYGVTLPWETDDESLTILSHDAMERILQLSMAEGNFSERPKLMDEVPVEFKFSSFVPIAMKLLELDANLGRMHARLMPRMEEEEFWANYHYRTRYLRASIGLDGDDAKTAPLGAQAEADVVIYEPEVLPPPRVTPSSSSAALASGADSVADSAGAVPNPNTGTAPPSKGAQQGESGAGEGVELVELTEEEKGAAALKKRKQEEAALAAEVEAELLNEDINGVDLGDLADLDDEDALEAELNGYGEEEEDGDVDLDLDDLSD
jgi:hypothetical protein